MSNEWEYTYTVPEACVLLLSASVSRAALTPLVLWSVLPAVRTGELLWSVLPAMRTGELPKQPFPQLPPLLLRKPNDVRHDSALSSLGEDEQGGPGHPADRCRLPRPRPPRVQ